MNWAQFKDLVSHMCLAGTAVACWFVTQEVAGTNTHFLQKYFSSSTDSVDSTEFLTLLGSKRLEIRWWKFHQVARCEHSRTGLRDGITMHVQTFCIPTVCSKTNSFASGRV